MTGLVYVAIVALWAAVLIPMWLRRHDDDQARRLDRHRSAMGTLASFSTPQSTAARVASRRRRTLLAALAVPAVLAVGAWLLGYLPTVAMAIGVLPVVIYAPLAAAAARRSATRVAQERPIAEPETAAPAEEDVPVDQATQEPSAPVARPTGRHAALASWDEVFDQSA